MTLHVLVQDLVLKEKWPESDGEKNIYIDKLSTREMYDLSSRYIYPEYTLVMCSINIALLNKFNVRAQPGILAPFEKLRCVNYMPHYQQFLFNECFEFTTVHQLFYNYRRYFDEVLEEEDIFVRPDKGTKPFGGQVVKREDMYAAHEMQSIAADRKVIPIKRFIYGFEDISPNELILVAPARNIAEEFRLVIWNKQVITGSRYKVNEELDVAAITKESRPDIFSFATDVIKHVEYEPDIGYVMDIGVSKYNGAIGLIELNSLSCSGMYDCDLELLFSTIEKFYNATR